VRSGQPDFVDIQGAKSSFQLCECANINNLKPDPPDAVTD